MFNLLYNYFFSNDSNKSHSDKDDIDNIENISVTSIKKTIPTHLFKKDTYKSMFYFIFDSCIIFTCFYNYSSTMSLLSYLIYANVLGFYMWCLFAVGHDCGHSTFSEYSVINSIVGHISHGFLLIPYYQLVKSHKKHHAYHNHITKDAHIKRFHLDEYNNNKKISMILYDLPIFIPFAYLFGYLIVGFGTDDGSHYFPWSKLFNTTTKDKLKYVLSTAVCYTYLYIFLNIWTLHEFFYMYFIPLLIFNSWLYMVTYIQHNAVNTYVYGDGEWNFTKGALETIDSTYDTVTGGVLDYLMHNITNGHVVHHLYPTIPHYNLIEATNIVKQQLGKHYRKIDGFPLLELLKQHFWLTRRHYIKLTDVKWVSRQKKSN